MRAAVDRVGIDSHGRSTKVQIRRVRKGDLAKARDVIEQTFTDFLERQLGTRPRQPFGGAQYVHHRWLMEPWGCFVAEEDQSKIVGAALARIHRITNGVCRGLELAKEVEIVEGLALGDTLLLERGAELVGFAIYHAPGVSEAPTGSLYVKYLAIDPRQRKVEHLEQAVSAIEELAQEQGFQRVILPVYLRYWIAYSTLVKCGYQVDFTMVRMQKGKPEDYEDAADLVLDDWR